VFAAGRTRGVDPVRHARRQLDHLDGERISGLRAVDVDRACQDVSTAPALVLRRRVSRGPQILDVLKDLIRLDAVLAQERDRILLLRGAAL
jgi:hypothetical protein